MSSGSGGTEDHKGNITTDAPCTPSNLQMLEQELEEFAARHGMPNADRRRNPLSPRHVKDFDGSTLFDEFARTVCMADVIPRKELFEAWAMASYVHNYFPKSQRIADLACSHGLLSWALLLMASADSSSPMSASSLSSSPSSSSSLDADDQERKHSENGRQRSVICIDKSMPRSSERVQLAMTKRWPELADRWDYVEGSLEGTVPAPTTLLVGVHCCGILSDKVIDLAIEGQAPLALVPCCHSKQCMSRKDREIFETTVMNTKNKGKDDCYATATSNFIDNLRMERLKNAGFTTQEARIPSAFTPKNRLILATPPNALSQTMASPPSPSETTTTVQEESKTEAARAIHADWQTKLFSIPVSDDPVARATIKSLAGRAAANQRKEPPPRSLSLSLYIPTKDYVLSLDKLNHVANQVVSSALVSPNRPPPPKQKQKNHQHFQQSLLVEVQVEQLFDSVMELKGGKFGRTYRVLYQHGKAKSTGETITEDGGGTRRPMCKEWAKQLHYELCLVLPNEFTGVVVRQLPR
jgi:hypothetical protein